MELEKMDWEYRSHGRAQDTFSYDSDALFCLFSRVRFTNWFMLHHRGAKRGERGYIRGDLRGYVVI